jgi:hypothetical protein
VPVAVTCWLVFTGIDDAAGEIAIETKFAAAAVTVKFALDCLVPELALYVAVIATVPDADPVATPAAVTLAIFESEELHCAELVTSCELPSDNFAVA